LKIVFLVTLLCIAQAVCAAQEPTAATAWFTQAQIEGAVQISKTTNILPEAEGTFGKGVVLTESTPIDDPLLRSDTGMISFWIKPNWNGNDGKTHRLLRIGDTAKNGILLEKSAKGMLRYVMACPKKLTVSRADVSSWKAGEWHQVAISWFSLNGKPLGLPLWIDKVAVDGPIAGGNTFIDPSKMADRRVWIGEARGATRSRLQGLLQNRALPEDRDRAGCLPCAVRPTGRERF
jgi:hypothetical protein